MSRMTQPFVFGAVLALAATMTACGGTPVIEAATASGSSAPTSASSPRASTEPAPPARSAPATRPGKPSGSPTSTGTGGRAVSNVSELRRLGMDLDVGVLIDVADDGRDRYLSVGAGGVVDFTGTGKSDNTMMALKPATVAANGPDTRNRVVIAPPFYNEDLGQGSCVADTAAGRLRLARCDSKAANQVWQAVPAGDSGQFELKGVHTDIRVEKGRLTTGTRGYIGLQTIVFAQ